MTDGMRIVGNCFFTTLPPSLPPPGPNPPHPPPLWSHMNRPLLVFFASIPTQKPSKLGVVFSRARTCADGDFGTCLAHHLPDRTRPPILAGRAWLRPHESGTGSPTCMSLSPPREAWRVPR